MAPRFLENLRAPVSRYYSGVQLGQACSTFYRGGGVTKFGLHAANKKCNTRKVEGINKRRYVGIILPVCFL